MAEPKSGVEQPSVEQRRVDLDMLRENWGYVMPAVGSMITFVLLFQPWIAATGPDGWSRANAFGHVDASGQYLTLYSHSAYPIAHISGIWAIFATTAIVATVFTAVVNVRIRTETAARLEMISSVAVAVFVLIALLYLNSKQVELKNMLARGKDLGGQIGTLLQWVFGRGPLVMPGSVTYRYGTASITPQAIIAAVTSLISAMTAVTHWMRTSHEAHRLSAL